MLSGPAFTLKQLVDRFEEAWQSGTAPPVEQFVSSVFSPGQSPDETIREALMELVAIDLEYRWQKSPGPTGYRPRLEDYVARLPKLGPWDTLPLDLIGSEYRARRRWGDRPAHEEYDKRFPRHGPELLEMLTRIDAQIALEFAGEGRAPPNSAWSAEPVHSITAFVEALRASAILPAVQLEQLTGNFLRRFPQPHALAKELLQRNWLTPYQVNQVLRGHGQSLRMGTYLVLERLGEGGAGQVLKACHQKMNRLVALKIIRKELLADPEVVGRFYREIQVVSQLNHPNVVHAYDAGPIGPTHFLAMEYVKGIDLGRMVKQGGPLPFLQACAFIRQAALGLQHAHERGLVHRDIKPHNLMLSVGEGLVKLLDLGLARLHRSMNEEVTAVLATKAITSLTPVNAVMMGTADYLAPEQALDFHRADIRADIYSLGCTFFYLLVGRPPFAGGTLAEKVAKHLHGEPPAVEPFRSDLPPGLGSLVRKMLAKQPEERFQTPGEVATALDVLQKKNGFCGPVPQRCRSRLPKRRLVFPALGGLALLALLVAIVTLVSHKSGSDRQQAGLRNLLERLDNPKESADLLRREVLAFLTLYPDRGADLRQEVLARRLRSPGPPQTIRLAQLLKHLPSPLDQLDPMDIPPSKRWSGQPLELVALLGDGGGPMVVSVAFTPDGKTLAVLRTDKFLKLWDPVAGKERATCPASTSTIDSFLLGSVACAPNGETVAVPASDGTVKLWKSSTGELQASLGSRGDIPHGLAYSPEGKGLIGAYPHAICWWDIATGKTKMTVPQESVLSVAVDPDGKWLATGAVHAVKFWHLTSGKAASGFSTTPSWVFAVAFAPDGQTLACALGLEHSVKLWDVPNRRVRNTLLGHTHHVRSVTYAPDGKSLASSGEDGQVSWWDAKTGKQLHCWQFPWPVLSVSFAPDGRHLATGNSNGTVGILRVQSLVRSNTR